MYFRMAIVNSRGKLHFPLCYKYNWRMKLYGKPLIHIEILTWVNIMTQIHNKMVCTAGSRKIKARTSISRTSNHKHERESAVILPQPQPHKVLPSQLILEWSSIQWLLLKIDGWNICINGSTSMQKYKIWHRNKN